MNNRHKKPVPEDIRTMLDSEFYSVEQNADGNRTVHILGYIYHSDTYPDGRDYRLVEFRLLRMPLTEFVRNYTEGGHQYVDETEEEYLQYISEITEPEARETFLGYFDGTPGTPLPFSSLTEDTLPGNYVNRKPDKPLTRKVSPIIDKDGSGPVTTELKQELADRLDFIYNEIAEEAGMNITYSESMDGSLFPEVVSLAMDEDADLESLRFLAQNNRILPDSLEQASLEEFREHIRANEREVLAEVESEAESDYRSRCQPDM